jgi:LPS-assembly lipoprotein
MTRSRTVYALKLPALKVLGATLAALSLAGCGFAPLYGAPGVTSTLASVQVEAPDGRTGELIREHLDDVLAHSADAQPAYRMKLQISEQRFPRGVRVDNVATRYEYVLTAAYVLTPVNGTEKPKTGRVRVEVTYDSADQPYASVAAQQDAQDRAAEEAARKIQLELAVWLAKGKT